MFRNSAQKLTIVAMIIVMGITLAASAYIYSLSGDRVAYYYSTYLPSVNNAQYSAHDVLAQEIQFTKPIEEQFQASRANLAATLIVLNITVLFAGYAFFYLIARKVLERIEKIYDARSKFAGYASHAIRTPLANMLLDTELTLSNNKASTTELREQLKRNLEEINRLKSLSKSLGKFVAIDSSGLEFKTVSLSKVVKNTIARYDPGGARIKADIPKKTFVVKANASGIDELIAILINSAYKYSFQGTDIHISLKEAGGNIVFRIASKGNPIHQDKLENIFEPFYRPEDEHGGEEAGLGLALARQIVDLHDGTILANSNNRGLLEFSFVLPLAQR